MDNGFDKGIPTIEALELLRLQVREFEPLSIISFLRLVLVSDELLRGNAECFERYKISRGKFQLLMCLYDIENLSPLERSPAELAEMARVSRATVSGLLDGLEREALVNRFPNSDDRRMIMVSLTQKGIYVISKSIPEIIERIQELMNGLTQEEKEELIRITTKLTNYLGWLLSSRS